MVVIADAPPEGVWSSTEDPGERATVRGKRYEIWRRTWEGGSERWILVQWDECVSERAAAWIARCRGHLPPGEPLPEVPVLELVEARRRAEDRTISLAAALSEAEREITALRAALDPFEST